MKPIKVLSLFDGISCGQVALERAGIPVEVYYASEIDKYAIQITQKNYPNTIQLGDINNIDFTQFIGKIDLIMGGSPCQDLSIAGKRKGLSGERSGLFYKFVEAIEVIKPKYFLLENNVGMPKEAYEEISRLLGCYPIEINSALVSAQTRKRYYWTNIGPQNFSLFGFPTCAIPQPENKGILLKDILESGIATKQKTVSLCATYYKGLGAKPLEQCYYHTERPFAAEPLKIPENTVKGYAEIEQGECMDLTHINSKTRRGRAMKEKCNCLQTQSDFYQYIKPCALRNRGQGKQPEINKSDKANALTSVQTDSMVCFNIPETVTVRKFEVDTDKLKTLLREHKKLSNKEIAEKLNQPITKVEHWFRTDNSFSIPDADIWLKLKALLNIKTDEFDASIMEFEEKENNYDKASRKYSVNGKMSTLMANGNDEILAPLQIGHIGNTNAQANRVYSVRNKSVTLKANAGWGGAKTGLYKIDLPDGEYLIRKLTPLECERLQTLDDGYTEGISATQRYKCIGNGWTVDVIAHIFKYLGEEQCN